MSSGPSEDSILIVDDDPATLKWLNAVLTREGYQVHSAETGAQALALFRAQRPQLIILDLTLPDMDGLEVCRQLRDEPQGDQTWILVLSARDRPEDIVRTLKAGADDYVPKRGGADVELFAKLKAMLQRPRREPAKQGKIVSLYSPKGGSGTSTLAVNLAYALTQVAPTQSVLLVDLVFPLGSIALMLDLPTTHTLARLSREFVNCSPNPKVISEYVLRVAPHSFYALSSANDLQEAQSLEINQIAPIFHTLRAMYDYIVVDFGRSLSRITIPVLELSDLILVIVTPDIAAAALTRRSLEYLDSLNIPQTRLALVQNRTVSRSWMSKEDLERAVGRPILMTVPHDGEQMTLALNAHMVYLHTYDNNVTAMALHDLAKWTLRFLEHEGAVAQIETRR